jgi:hypothetical protein
MKIYNNVQPKSVLFASEKKSELPNMPDTSLRLDEPTEGVKQEWDFMFNSSRHAKD